MNEKRYKEDLRNILKQEYGFSERGSADALNKFFGLIARALEEERYVMVKGLGIFKLIDVESRKSVDVNTGKIIEIPEHRKISFSVDTALKELINKPFSHFEAVELKDEKLFVEEESVQDKDDINMDNQETPNITPAEVPPSDEGVALDASLTEKMEEVLDTLPTEREEETVVASPVIVASESPDTPSMEKVEEPKRELSDEKVTLGEAIRMRADNRRKEWRMLEREMEREEKSNRIALLVISIFMFLLMMAGLLFVLAPEFLEKLFY